MQYLNFFSRFWRVSGAATGRALAGHDVEVKDLRRGRCVKVKVIEDDDRAAGGVRALIQHRDGTLENNGGPRGAAVVFGDVAWEGVEGLAGLDGPVTSHVEVVNVESPKIRSDATWRILFCLKRKKSGTHACLA